MSSLNQMNNDPKPLVASFNPQTQEQARPTFWFRRDDGMTFCADEEEAWNIRKHGIKVMQGGEMKKKHHKYLGCSTGEIYFAAVKEANLVMKKKGKGLKDAQEILRKAVEEECASADPKVSPRDMDISGDEKAREQMRSSSKI